MARQTNNAVWNYFERDYDSKKGTCILCGGILSYKTTITNLKQHLRKKHLAAYREFLAQQAVDTGKLSLSATIQLDKDEEESFESEVQGSDTWSFFEKETGGRVRCVICRETMSNHAATMRTHLKRDHPKVTVQTSDNDSDNEESHNDSHTEVVYLIDSRQDDSKDANTPTKETPKKLALIGENRNAMFITAQVPEIRKRRHSSTEPKTPDEEELEKFGQYVTCLMKTVPKDLCTQLQMDVINLIMTTKINRMARKETPALAPQALEVASNSGDNSSNILLERVPVTSQITSRRDSNSPYIVAVANENGKVQRVITNNALRNTVTVVEHTEDSKS